MDIKKVPLAKSFNAVTKNHSISQSQQQRSALDIQGKEIRLRVNLLYLTLFRLGICGAAHGGGWRGGNIKSPLPKICHTFTTMMKVGRIIPHLKNI